MSFSVDVYVIRCPCKFCTLLVLFVRAFTVSGITVVKSSSNNTYILRHLQNTQTVSAVHGV